MKHTKISVTLESDIETELRQVAGAGGISAFVNETIRQQLQAARLRPLLDEMEAQFGPIPDQVRREIDGQANPG